MRWENNIAPPRRTAITPNTAGEAYMADGMTLLRRRPKALVQIIDAALDQIAIRAQREPGNGRFLPVVVESRRLLQQCLNGVLARTLTPNEDPDRNGRLVKERIGVGIDHVLSRRGLAARDQL